MSASAGVDGGFRARAGPRDFWSFAALLLAVRGWLVLALADVFLYGEELEKGTAAKAMLDGIDVAHHRLAYHYYEGGGFVISHLKALAFLLVGESVAAHKLVALVTCLAVFAAGWRLVNHHFGRRAALWYGLLFVFGPASVQKLSLLSLGIHFEATAFLLFVLDEGLRLAWRTEEGDDGAPRPWRVARLGLAAGFGIFFSYQVALAVGYVGLLLLLLRRDAVFGRAGLAGVAGLVAGLAPLLVMAALVGGAVLDVHGTALVEGADNGARLVAFARSAYADKTALELVPLVLYPASALAAAAFVVAVLPSPLRPRVACLLGFPLLWFAAYASSGFVMDAAYHWYVWGRFAPVWAVALPFVALAIQRARACVGGVSARLWTAAGAALLALGVLNTARLLAAAHPFEPRRNLAILFGTKGYHYMGYFPMLLGHLEGDHAARLRPLLGFDEPQRSLLYADLATVGLRGFPGGVDEELALLRSLDPDGLLDFARGLGPSIVRRAGRDLDRALAAAHAMGGELGERLAEAVGRFGRDWYFTPQVAEVEIATHRQDPAFLRGLGARVCRAFVFRAYGGPELVLDPEAARAFLARQPGETVPHLVEGFEAEWERWRLR